MISPRSVGPAFTEMARRAVGEPATFHFQHAILREAIAGLPPQCLSRLASWQNCLQPTKGNEQLCWQMRRILEGRPFRRSTLPPVKAFRRVDFGDGLELLFVADHPAAEIFMRKVMPKTGVHEPELVSYLKRTVRSGDLIVDLGAHVGYVSCIAAALGATVLAVEMQPTLIPMIQLNAAVNDLWTVHPLCAAVSDHLGLVPSLRVSPSPGLQATVAQWETGTYSRTGMNHDLVPSLTLDSLFAEQPYPSLVKVDVEGAEARVLAGAKGVIAAARTTFMVEVHAHLLHWAGNALADIVRPFPADRWTLSMLTPSGTRPLSREQFLDPEGPIARHVHNAPVLFEPLAV